MTFSTDRDLLVFEPRLFSELAWPGQTLACGSDGHLAGTAFTSASANFVSARLSAGMVLAVQGASALPAALEIVHVDSGTHLTVSALRADPTATAIAPPIAGGTAALAWHVVSFAAQAEAVAMEMLASFGLAPADPASPWTAEDIAHPEALRPLSANGVLAVVLAGAANRGNAQEDGLWAKAVHYRAKYEQLLVGVRLGLDRDGDGNADVVRHLGAARLRRD